MFGRYMRSERTKIMNEIDVTKIDQSNLPPLQQMVELLTQNTIKINELVEWANRVENILGKIIKCN